MNRLLLIVLLISANFVYSQNIDFGATVYFTSNTKEDVGPFSLIDSMNYVGSGGSIPSFSVGLSSNLFLKKSRKIRFQYRFQMQHLNRYEIYADFIRRRTLRAVQINQHFHSLSAEYVIPVPKINRLFFSGGLAARFHFARDKRSYGIDPEMEELSGHIKVSDALFEGMRNYSFSYLFGLEYKLSNTFSILANFERTFTSMLGDLKVEGETYTPRHFKNYINVGVNYRLFNLSK